MTEQQAERLVAAIEALAENMAIVAHSNAMLIKAITEEAGSEEVESHSNPLGTLDQP